MRTTVSSLLLCLALFAAACSGGDDDAATTDAGATDTADAGDDTADTDDAQTDDSATDDAGDASDTPADEPAIDLDAEVFSIDEGAGCAVYVSVPEADATGDLRLLIWQGVVTNDFSECGFSDVVEVGLLTVNGLDSYNQPDFSQTIEHVYYGVDGWDALVSDCYAVVLDGACTELLAASFSE